MNIQQKIGNRIRELRREKKISQEALAEKAGYDKHALSNIECGKTNVAFLTLTNIIQALGITISEFFTHKLFQPNDYQELEYQTIFRYDKLDKNK